MNILIRSQFVREQSGRSMEIIACPHCQMRVAVKADGTCPSCRCSVASSPAMQPPTSTPNKFCDNPYESPKEASLARRTSGMTVGESIYSAVVILCAGLYLLACASFVFIVLPRMEDAGIFYFVITVMGIFVLTLAITTALNLYYRSLLIVPTIVQCFVMALSLYFIPVTIWGGVLLYRRIARDNLAAQQA